MSRAGSDPGARADAPRPPASDFVREIVAADLAAGRIPRGVVTRFPPEPNGYLHVGHAKAICIDFGIARELGGRCNLRMDDTNPTKESEEYVRAIEEDVRWLGFEWSGPTLYASDYFGQLWEWAEQLVRQGDAYVDELSGDEIREHRGTLTAPGRPSPWRERPAEESLALMRRMRAGELPEGSMTVRAKIDMASPNMNLRDPVLYRVLHARHHRTGDAWHVYPTYDWAHGQSDSIEGVTHSLCTLEFENHRPLYDWFLERLGIHRPRQIEFARLALTYTVLSKRKLLELVREGLVTGWDDPRMPTLRGMRRRGYTPEALRALCERVGVTKFNSLIDVQLLQECLRADLNRRAPRRMAVLRPLELVVEDWPAGRVDELDCLDFPDDPGAGSRKAPFSGRLWIERDDFREEAPRKYFRLKPGQEVRLRYAYLVTCTGFDKDPATGEVVRVRCRHDPGSRGGDAPDGRKVQGTIHWVDASRAFEAEVRLYDHLFRVPEPDDVPEGEDWKAGLNPDSLEVVRARLEPALERAAPGERFQFERLGYFCVDTVDSAPGRPVFLRTVPLKDGWAKIERREGAR